MLHLLVDSAQRNKKGRARHKIIAKGNGVH